MSTQESQPEKPVWEVKVRPLGETHTPWRRRASARARSTKRKRSCVAAGLRWRKTPRCDPTGSPPFSPGKNYALRPLVCSKCGYSLEGLTLDRASVTCIECTHTQPLIAYVPENSGMIDKHHPVIGLFAIIGIIATILFLLLISLPIIFTIL